MEREKGGSRRLILLAVLGLATLLSGAAQAAIIAENLMYVDHGAGYTHPAHRSMNMLDVHRAGADAVCARALPAVLLFHGGGFVSGSKDGIRSLADWVASHGFVVFNANYRMADQYDAWWGYPYPAAYEDAEAALAWVRMNAAGFCAEGGRVASMGISAGATVAAILGVAANPESRAAAVVGIAGRMDFTRQPVGFDPRPHFLPKRNYAEASPLHRASASSAPFFFLHGLEDQQVEIEHSRLMLERLRKYGVAESRILEFKTDHMGIYDLLIRESPPAVFEFLRRQLLLRSAPH